MELLNIVDLGFQSPVRGLVSMFHRSSCSPVIGLALFYYFITVKSYKLSRVKPQ
jgi:hypothetical protein